jgi:hypothetical protein
MAGMTTQPITYMQRILKSTVQAFACLALALFINVSVQAGPADGTWTWTTPGRNGGADRTTTLKLKSDGDKLTGSVSPMREGGEDIQIKDGKIKGDEISFNIERPGRNGGAAQVQKYTGKISGDKITGKLSGTRGDQEFSRDWEAKKKTDDKK